MTLSADGFEGPFTGGPPPEALVVDAPSIERFGPGEVARLIVIGAVLAACTLVRLGRRVWSRRGSWVDAAAAGVVDGFEVLGPTFVKLGQLIASSPGLFPVPLADAALRCLDDVRPFPAAMAREMIAADLGRSPEELFSAFDDRPLSAASIGQVHACVLPDGRRAVIKVQRPGIRERMTTDLRIMYRLARVLQRRTAVGRKANAVGLVRDLHQRTFQELNPALEAYRQSQFRDAITLFGDNKFVTAPEVYWEYCGPHLICMERMDGVPMDEFELLQERGVDGELALRRAIKVWMEACMLHGPFHGDVHAGNLWLLEDQRVAYLDFGIMGHLDEGWRRLVQDLFFTTMVDGDFTRVARAFKEVGAFPEDIGTDEEVGLRMHLAFGAMLDLGLSKVSLGEVLTGILDLMHDHAGTTPEELLLITKQLLYFERYGKVHAPDWALARDLFLIRNVFPEVVAATASERGILLPD